MTTPPFRVKALFDYTSQEEDDLNFKGDQIITVTEEEDADWYYGEFEDESGAKQEGLFPRNFVKAFEPERPPRPARSGKTKRDAEPHASDDHGASVAPTPDVSSPRAQPPSSSGPARQTADSRRDQGPAADPQSPKDAVSASTADVAAPKLPPVNPKPPPPAAEKPSSNAFRDRINAFNKPAAPPVTPMKPGGLGASGGSGFIKKPFVAPPPSKNAYVPPPRQPPPQKGYRREDDPELSKTSETALDEINAPATSSVLDESEQDQPKPTTLKDRIALLQKQQMEQAARHAEASQKKEKQKRPAKSADDEELPVDHDEQETEVLEKVESAENAGKRSIDAARRHRKSKEEAAVTSPRAVFTGEILSDGNEADQSGAGDTEDGEETSTGKDDSDGGGEEDEENGEDEIDPEVKRRMEIRERMAKMSGGMGMAAMFGAPGGLQSKSSTKKSSGSSERKGSGQASHATDSPAASTVAPVPIMPDLHEVQSPDQAVGDVGKEDDGEDEELQLNSFIQGRNPEHVPDVEETHQEPLAPTRLSSERSIVPPLPQARPVPRPPPSRELLSPSEGSASDDELSSYDRRTTGEDSTQPLGKEGPPPQPKSPIPYRPQPPPSRPSEDTVHETEKFPSMSDEPPKRTIRAPIAPAPIPPTSPATQNRAPPPPPPLGIPPRRAAAGEKFPVHGSTTHKRRDSDEEVTEYDGDYDTDIASGTTHKDALKAHTKAPSFEDDSITEESSLHHSGLPSIGPPPAAAPRAIPPLPPSASHPKRQSSDMPRGAPPPPPPPKQTDADEDYDPYRYTAPVHGLSTPQREDMQMTWTPTVEEPDPAFSSPSSQHRRGPSLNQLHSQQAQSPNMSAPTSSLPRHSSDVQRTSTSIRRSTDVGRPSNEYFMAGDVDLAQASQWWTRANAPPQAFQNRQDIIFEVDENSTTKRGGKKSIAKEVYVLYMDYSQTIVSAHYETADPITPSVLEQRHEPPPRSPRQDELEGAHGSIGVRLAESAKSKEGTTIGEGSPHSLPLEIITSIPDALRPVGIRAYGAVVYANLANASVQQHDEIRPGDVVTFRNAKFGGHKGPMKAKYSLEVGKPDHVGIVVDWDGTKKKLRAWEQGRESKKVKAESYKLGDMKSGEVKVWRVMGRSWVNWEGTN
ncbi:uncharacterized protein KY384_003190 [Bacidia gigantensis]|uniref:uncharacterized protein n=1 Tax=Bacidia gigantensis TaxID=2732470 RepID=UPI001D03A6A4|nr:uncharacterized protein KY384_003190 [Bacidia gigantensis]KAG8531560.1 hypothetical protein KY384_003190 [Bacidia gigantensis]